MPDTHISAIKQAALPSQWETSPSLLTGDKVTVAVQHIALARIDVQTDGTYGDTRTPYSKRAAAAKPRRTVLNLYGTNDIDRLIEALTAAKARMQAEQDLLNQLMGRKATAGI